MSNHYLSHILTAAIWTIAIAHCLTSRFIFPFLKSLYAELFMPSSTNLPMPLAVVKADVSTPVKSTVKKARRRSSTKTVAA